MKKIFTLLFCVGILSTAMAQSDRTYQNGFPGRDDRNFPRQNDGRGYGDSHDYGYGQNNQNGRYDHRDDYSIRSRDEQIARINWEYDARIRDIRSRAGGWWFQKNRMIRNLEMERRYKINAVCEKFNVRNGYGNHHNESYPGDERDNGWRH